MGDLMPDYRALDTYVDCVGNVTAVECPDAASWYREYIKRIMWAKYALWSEVDDWQYWVHPDSIGM